MQKSVVYLELIQSHTINNSNNEDDDCTLFLNLNIKIRKPPQLYRPVIHHTRDRPYSRTAVYDVRLTA